jgi:hypothetical protein
MEVVTTGYCYRVVSNKASHALRPFWSTVRPIWVIIIHNSFTRALWQISAETSSSNSGRNSTKNVREFCGQEGLSLPSGVHIVGTGSGAPEVPEPPSARGYSRATRPQGEINSWDLSSRLGVGRRANTPASLKKSIVQKPKEVYRTALRKRPWKRKYLGALITSQNETETDIKDKII